MEKEGFILDILEDKEISVKEKKNEIGKVKMEDFLSEITFEVLTKVIKMAEITKNFEITKFLQSILKQVSLKPYYKELVSFMNRENITNNLKLSKFLVRFYKIPTIYFIENFLE